MRRHLVPQSSLATYHPGDGTDAGLASIVAMDVAAAPPSPGVADATTGPDAPGPPPDAEPDGAGSVPPPDAGSVAYTTTLTMDSVSIPANGDTWYCQTFANPFGAQVDIVQYEVDMTPTAYQMFAYYNANAVEGAVGSCSSLTTGQFTFTSENGHDVVAYPPGVGATITAGTGFNLVVHYVNTSATAAPGQATLTMSVARPGLVSQHAGVVFLDDTTLQVAPDVSTTTSMYTLTQALTVFESESVMGLYGTKFTLSVPGQTLYTTTSTAHPAPGILAPAVPIGRGIVMTWACTYDNFTLAPLSFGGGYKQARCQSTSFVYPIADVLNPVIGPTAGP
jgi:hypothetical protein